jgi:hypothetical protein
MLEYGSCRLYTVSTNQNEYKKIHRTLSGENKMSVLDEELINDALTTDAINKLSKEADIYLIHDPSDIRKPYSVKAENLGKVRDLQNNIINGYNTHNIIAITPNSKSVHLISHESYSNKDAKFLKAELVRKIETDKLDEEQVAAKKIYDSDNWYNKKTLTKDRIQKVSAQLKKTNQHQKITHIMDREFDDNDYFSTISLQGDDFVIRSKKSRSIDNIIDPKAKKTRLIDLDFPNQHIHKVQKVRFKNACYQDASLLIGWQEYGDYTAVKITAKTREGKGIFQNPMLLITNKSVTTEQQAMLIYQIYLKRSRIETVFKFLKEGLGWEELQVRNFLAIQKLLSFCFFIAAYLYNIGDQEVHDDYVILLARLGGGKGVVSKHYILQGIKALLSKCKVDRFFEEYKPSEDTIVHMLSVSGAVV